MNFINLVIFKFYIFLWVRSEKRSGAYFDKFVEYVIIEYSVKEKNFNAFIQIIDNNGKIVKSLILRENHTYQVIPLNDLPNGIYFIKLKGLKSNNVKKITINR